MTRARGKDGELLEGAFQAQVIGLARFYGWRIFHAPDNRPAGKTGRVQRMAAPEAVGFPDLVLVRPPELLFVELKAERGRLGPGQAEWLEALGEVAAAVERAAEAALGESMLDGGDYRDGPRPDVTALAVEVYLWRPSDWPALECRLARGRVLQPVPAPQ